MSADDGSTRVLFREVNSFFDAIRKRISGYAFRRYMFAVSTLCSRRRSTFPIFYIFYRYVIYTDNNNGAIKPFQNCLGSRFVYFSFLLDDKFWKEKNLPRTADESIKLYKVGRTNLYVESLWIPFLYYNTRPRLSALSKRKRLKKYEIF